MSTPILKEQQNNKISYKTTTAAATKYWCPIIIFIGRIKKNLIIIVIVVTLVYMKHILQLNKILNVKLSGNCYKLYDCATGSCKFY